MRNRAWLVFAVFFCWKVVLLLATVQPIPANDSYFFDGAIIQHLLHGGYYNPSIAEAFPVSGTQLFSAYPPLHQLALLGWMKVFGTSAFSSVAMQVTLIGIFIMVMLAIFRRLLTPAWCVQFGGGFLFLLTFHDRPDTLAHVFGMLAVYAWVRSQPVLSGKTIYDRRARWTWLAVLFVIFALAASLQIGTVYLGWVWLGNALISFKFKERFPVFPLVANLAVPLGLVCFVKLEMPVAWAGFQENLHITNFFTGLRVPSREEVLKVLRTAPGILLVAAFFGRSFFRLRRDPDSAPVARNLIVLVPGLLAAAGIAVGSLFALAPNSVGTIPGFLQPLVVICYLAVDEPLISDRRRMRAQVICLTLAMLLCSIRAIGMSTWGIACARDVSYWSAIARVRQELDNAPSGAKVIVSSAFLYEAARHDNIKCIHSDWLRPPADPANFTAEGWIDHRPRQLILTQFDYFRRFQALLEEAKSDPRLLAANVENMARTPAPDSFKSAQKIVQHVSWAPVIVNLTWK